MSQELSGGIALVTGGSSGIGRAAAVAFAAEGANVVIASRREANSLETVRLVKEAGGEAFFIRADVSRSSEVQEMVARTVERYGGLNYPFNNLYTRVLEWHPMGRFGTPAEVAQAVVWLCSKRAQFVTGHTLQVDGGFVVP